MSRILIVEDDLIVAKALSAVLDHGGHEVVGLAEDETTAVHCAGATHPDIVLLDIHLAEGSDGIETAQRLRAMDGMTVIFMSAHQDNRTLERVAAAKPAGFLIKPFSHRELLEMLKSCRSTRAAPLAANVP